MLPIDMAFLILKEEKPDIFAGMKPDIFGNNTPEPNEKKERLCEFCESRPARIWTSRIPPGRDREEGHAGMYFGICSTCNDERVGA